LRRVWRIDDATLAGLAEETAAALAGLHGRSWTTSTAARAAIIAATTLDKKVVTAVLKTIAVADPAAEPLRAKTGDEYEPDTDLRDQENIPLPAGYLEMSEDAQTKAVREAAEQHLVSEIHPYVPDAWIDHAKTRIGYEIPFTRQFYVYTPPRPVAEIRADIDKLEQQIQTWMQGLTL